MTEEAVPSLVHGSWDQIEPSRYAAYSGELTVGSSHGVSV